MKPEKYNPKAREAFGRSLIDIGVSIFKAIMLLVTAVPLAAITKGVFSSHGQEVSVWEALNSVTPGTQVLIFALLIVSFLIGHYFRKEGLRHIHETEEPNKENITIHSSRRRFAARLNSGISRLMHNLVNDPANR